MRTLLLAGLLGLTLCGQSIAQTTGNDYRHWCETHDPICTSYVVGFTHGLALGDRTIFCPPSAVTNGQIIEVVKAYMRSHPEEHHLEMSTLIYIAVQKAFPCRKSR